MIFVTVGASKMDFNRLVEKADYIAGIIKENIVMQIGISKYHPVNAEYFRFIDRSEIIRFYKEARVIICHAGIGTILTALELNKPTIVVPRLKEYGEHHDNHQLEISKKLEEEGRIMAVYDISKLEDVLNNINTRPVKIDNGRIRLINTLMDYLKKLEK